MDKKRTPVSSFGKNAHYKVYDAGKIIGASEGIDTPYIRVECFQGVIHGHPITKRILEKIRSNLKWNLKLILKMALLLMKNY